jgi:hypothetical protein
VSGLLGSLASCVADPLNCSSLVGSATGSVISAGANTIIGAWAADFQKAEATMLSTLMGSWLKLSTPNVSDSSTSAVAFLTQNTAYLVGICGIVGLLIAAARMMWYQRAEPAREALAGLLRLVVVQGCAVSAIGLLSAAGDSLATSIMNNATAMAGTGAQSLGQISMSAVGSATLVIVLSGLAIIAFFVQLVLLIVRDGLLVLMAGTLPLSAAASMTPVGNSWFRKNVGWLLAFLLFKPIAALVYGAAILSVTNSTDITGEITGIVLVALATLTLPALMRMVAPMVSAIGNISAASAAGMVAGVATGAVAIVATGGAAAPMVAAGAGRQAGNLGSQALGSASAGADNLASGSASPATGAGAPGSVPPQAPATNGASVGTTNGSKANG